MSVSKSSHFERNRLILLAAVSYLLLGMTMANSVMADTPGEMPTQASVHSKIKRISGVLMNSGEVLGIYVSPGLATLVEAPCPISEATVGNPKDIARELSDKNPNVVRLFLSSSLSMSSNLIIQCSNEVIVLDLYPSKTTHQDYLKIEGTYGGPELSGTQLSPIGSQNVPQDSRALNEYKNLILVQEGGSKPQKEQKKSNSSQVGAKERGVK